MAGRSQLANTPSTQTRCELSEKKPASSSAITKQKQRWLRNAKNSLETNRHHNRTPVVRINLHRTIRYRIGMVELMTAYARATDPLTSHAAAASVDNISKTQQAILVLLRKKMTDEELVQAYLVRASLGKAPRASVSGIRSRRSELARLGLVQEAGITRTESNRAARVWKRA